MMLTSCRIRIVCVALLFATGSAQIAVAADAAVEKLLKVLPDDVVAFVATGGCDALRGDFEKSIPGRICNDPGVRSFCESIKTELLAKLKQESEDPNVAERIDMALDCLQLAASRPLVFGVARVEVADGPPVCAFAILDAGDRKPELAAAVTRLEAMVGRGMVAVRDVGSFNMHSLRDNDDVPLYWGWVDNYLVLAANDAQRAATKYLANARAAAPEYSRSVPGRDDALAMYVDLQEAKRIAAAIAREEGGEEKMKLVTAVIDELGLGTVGTLVGRIGFAGPDVVSRSLLKIPEPRTGLFAALGAVDPSWFGAVDARAVMAGAVNCDVAAMYDAAMRAIKAASPDEVYPKIQKGIATLESEVKLNLRNDLLASLAGPMVAYSLPAGMMMEAPRGGFVAVAELRDVRLFEKTMTALGRYAELRSKGMLQISSQTQDEGRVMHAWVYAPLAMAQMMPTWTVVDKHVVIGSNMALCNVGAKQLASRGGDAKSLLDTQGYKKVAARLPENLVSLTYTDSQVQFAQTRMRLQEIWPMLTVVAGQGGVKLPIMLPSLTQITEDMGPSCQYSYFDPEGLHGYYRGPGVEAGPSYAAVPSVALAAGILMPALARTRELAFRMTSGTNLSAIGKACLLYANDYDDNLPPDLQTLVEKTELPPKCLESKRKPKGFDGPSYIYLSGQTLAMYPGNIVAYENPEFCREGVNVLFLDSHVEFMKPESFRRELEETCERLGRDMPEVRFKGETEARPSRRPVSPKPRPVPDQATGDELASEPLRVPDQATGDKPASVALHKAASKGDLEEVRRLLAAGTDIDAKNQQKETALYSALKSGHVDVAALLTSKGADVNAKGGRWGTPLLLAARFGYAEIAEPLISRGADIEAALGGGWTPLLLAVRFGHTDVAKLLIDKGADLRAKTNEEMTPLLFAVLHDRKEIEELLIARGLQPDVFAESMRGDAGRVAAYLENDRSLVNAQRGHFTLLHWAAYCGHLDVAKVLLENGADINANSEEAAPLYWAVRKNHGDIIELFLAEGADANAKSRDGRTVLHHAVTREAAELLVKNGADADAADQRGATPLHTTASGWGHRGALKLLIPSDADINARHPETLHRKAAQQQAAVAQVLLAHGAKVGAKDKRGMTALDVAEKAGYGAVAEVLRQHAGEPSIK